VIEAINATLGLPDDALELTWRSLKRGRQPVIVIGIARIARHNRQTAAEWKPGGPDGDGSRLLFRTRVAALALR